MRSENLLNINLAQVAKEGKRLTIKLDEGFFAGLGQEEISDGDVLAEIAVRASAADIYDIDLQLSGTVTVMCDRCLEPLDLKIQITDSLKAKDGEPEDSDGPELLYTEGVTPVVDLSWSIYEIIETSLPIQRMHTEGECNPEMTGYIIGNADSLNGEDESFN